MSSLGGPEHLAGSRQREDVPGEERLRAVHRHAEHAARELDRERADSVLHLARAFGAIDHDEVVAQFEARVGFLERQVERLVGRRDQVDRAVHGELQLMRTRVAEALRAVEAAGEADRRARQALEARMQGMIEGSERRVAAAAKALRESLVASWEDTVESERGRRERAHMEALESELNARATTARELIGEIRTSLEAQVVATVRAAQALTESAFGSVVDRLPSSDVRVVEAEAHALPPASPPEAQRSGTNAAESPS